MGKGAEIVKALVSPINKLIDCVRKACGKLYEPTYIRKMAKANAFAVSTMQEAISNAPELAQAFASGAIKIDNKNLNDLAVRSFERSIYQEIVKQQNFESVVEKAYGLLDGEPDVTDEPVGQDWIARFINSVETISDGDMQLLWAKVLAGEIKKPKTYSLRTLENLKNLSKDEALLFQDYCEFVITKGNDSYFVNEKELLDKSGLNVDIQFQLDDCGIVQYASFIKMEHIINPDEHELFYNDSVVIVCKNKTPQPVKIDFEIISLTKFGHELVSIIGKDASDNFLLEFARFLKKKFTDIEVNAYKVTGKIDDGVKVDKSKDLIAD